MQRLHVTRRDGEDLFLTTERHDRQRTEAAEFVSLLLLALIRTDDGERVIAQALPAVFPWVRHLSAAEIDEFAGDLVGAMRDIVELDVPGNLHRVIVEWRSTARILADPESAAQATRPLPDEDHGTVIAP